MPLKTSERKREYNKKYYLKNKEQIEKRKKEYRLKNKEKIREYWKRYHLRIGDQVKEYSKKYYLKNKERIIRRIVKYDRHKLCIDLNYRLKKNLRARIWTALKGKMKSDSTMKLVGCSLKEFWDHLEKKFQAGMTRKNHGLWHVDHIIPCASFDFSDPEQQKKCFHYINLQPLWAIDNIRKGKKIISGDITSPKK